MCRTAGADTERVPWTERLDDGTVCGVYGMRGDHDPEGEHLLLRLTDRRREVTEVTVDTGYCDTPWQVTHGDTTDAVAVAPGAVGETPRKAELGCRTSCSASGGSSTPNPVGRRLRAPASG